MKLFCTISLYFVLSLSTFICFSQSVIKGKAELPENTLVKVVSSDAEIKDSCLVKNREFTLRFSSDSIWACYFINFSRLSKFQSFPIMLKAGENASINFLDSNFVNKIIKGGLMAEEQDQFWAKLNLQDKKSSRIIDVITKSKHYSKEQLEKLDDSVRRADQNLFFKKWIVTHPNSPFSACVLRLFVFQGSSMKRDTVAESLYDHLSFAAKKNNSESAILLSMFTMTNPGKYEKEFLNSLNKESNGTVQREEEMKRYKVPEFKIKDTLGNEISLSALKGSYVFIDFWASWCKPCRENMPRIKQIYNSYSQKKLIVLSISADENKEKWIKAIRDEQMTWLNGSDLLGTDKGVVKKYEIGFFPQYFLIDPDGYSIQKSRSNLNTISEQLAEIFHEK